MITQDEFLSCNK